MNKQTVEVLPKKLKDIFSPSELFSREKYLLYKTKTEEKQFLSSEAKCSCIVCGTCWNPVASISIFEDGVFEQVSLTSNCLDCFVICGDRKTNW
jgi:hypothetical protein